MNMGLEKMNVLSLFSGIGGLDIAAEWVGMKTVAFCEIDDYACRVLGKRWKDVPVYRDVRELTAARLQNDGLRIDLVTGGFPCQPHSLAGKRLAQDDERDLWGECERILREVQPRWATFENVPGLLSSDSGRFFRRVLWGIAKAGYDACWVSYAASDVGSPQKRQRVFIVAYSQCR
ncbi:MAG: DNA cytosine methyltransferase [Negativicutes bacterium]